MAVAGTGPEAVGAVVKALRGKGNGAKGKGMASAAVSLAQCQRGRVVRQHGV